MELIPLTRELHTAWDDFCLESPDAWFLHTTDWLKYNLAYRPELRPTSYSFMCREKSQVVAIVPLVVSHHEQDARQWKSFTLCGNGIPTPALIDGLSAADRDDVLDIVFDAIQDLAHELGVAHARFRIEALRPAMREPRYAPFNILLRHDFIDCSTGTTLLDLRPSESALWGGLRRNHRRCIEKARDVLQIDIHSGADLTDAKFDEYVQMHARAAGRVTRPRATFEMMRDWIQAGRGLVAEAINRDGRSVGFELYVMYKRAALGLSACNEPDCRLPIRHLIEWDAILWMRERGIEFYEVGRQQFGILPYDFPEKKNRDISHFKYGFGGVTIPSFEGERFYSFEHWQIERRARDEIFAARYPWDRRTRGGHGQTLLRRFEAASTHRTAAPNEESPLDASGPIPESLISLAEAVIQANPERVNSYLSGNVKVLHSLVGRAMRGDDKNHDPRQVRRAVEHCLAQVITGQPGT
jgi:hypothetical protein